VLTFIVWAIAGWRLALFTFFNAVSHLRDYHDHHVPFYDRMRAHRLAPASRSSLTRP